MTINSTSEKTEKHDEIQKNHLLLLTSCLTQLFVRMLWLHRSSSIPAAQVMEVLSLLTVGLQTTWGFAPAQPLL